MSARPDEFEDAEPMERFRRRRRRRARRSDRPLDPRTDEVAREAARLVEAGHEATVRGAILAATRILDAWDVPRPSVGRVREHARSMALEEQGVEGYVESILELWSIAEEVMAVLEHALPDVETALVGRSARGQIDAGVVLRIRAYTDHPIGELAAALVEHGFEEPEFETLATRVGLLDQIRFLAEGEEVAVIRVPRSAAIDPRTDLVTGRRTDFLDLERLRERLGEEEDAGESEEAR